MARAYVNARAAQVLKACGLRLTPVDEDLFRVSLTTKQWKELQGEAFPGETASEVLVRIFKGESK